MVTSTIKDKPADDSVTLYSVVYDEYGGVILPGGYDCKNVTWTINGTVVGTGCELKIKDSVAGDLKIVVTYKDPELDRPVSKEAGMSVKALEPERIYIQKDSVPKPYNSNAKALKDSVYFSAADEYVKVYAVLRDKYGNFAGYAETKPRQSANDWYSEGGAQWTSLDTNVATVSPRTGSSPIVHKEFMGEGTRGELIVSYRVCWVRSGSDGRDTCATLSDTVNVGSRSEGGIAVGPNPFSNGPNGRSISEALDSRVIEFYRDAINNAGGPGVKGVLIAVDAPGPIDGKDKRFGKIIIYDAVGNVVKVESLSESNRARSSYGYVWDGKNTKGRFVGPGTYLVRVSGNVVSDGSTVKLQRMVGVKK